MGSKTSSETTSPTNSWKQKFILKHQAKKQKFIRDHEKGLLKYMKFMNALTTRLIDGREDRVCTAASIYDIEDMNHRKQAVQMSKFKGKVLLIMNVAKK